MNEPRRAPEPPPRRHDYAELPMVEWYHPYQLLTTGLQVLVWDYIGQSRSMEERARERTVYPYDGYDGREQLWFDYVADVGDGWNPTFAIASLIAQPELEVAGQRLPHGRFLVLGGDEVYPVPSREMYERRFVQPYAAALPASAVNDAAEPRAMFAIPGNHDWYDGLVSFSREFTHVRPVGGWQTRQSQSYFALRLPHRWWLWGMDVMLASRMDFGQRTYFESAAAELQPGDSVIVVTADPDWIKVDLDDARRSHVAVVERELIAPREARVRLWLSGDLHHYRRHERREPDGDTNPNYQRITSGGGGAYTSPTHRPSARTVVVDDTEFARKAVFPSSVTSFRLSLLNVLFAFKNWKLALFPMGTLYWLLTWARLPEGWPAPSSWLEVLRTPGVLLWLFVILGGFVVFADGSRWGFRWFGGLAHGAAHVLTATTVTAMINRRFLEAGLAVSDLVAASVFNFLAGVLLGTTVFGLYLLLSLNLFGTHANGAFSSLRIQDYKHFLRLHITCTGQLEIFPIAIRRVPRRGDGRARYHLIEGPVVIDPRAADQPRDRTVQAMV